MALQRAQLPATPADPPQGRGTPSRPEQSRGAAIRGRFWLACALVVPANLRVPKILTSGALTVAVRVPHHPTTRALIDAVRAPLATTSANISGARDPSSAPEVLEQLNGRLPLILDGGPTRGNMPSTVVDVTTDPPTVRRIGVISIEQIEQALGRDVHKELDKPASS